MKKISIVVPCYNEAQNIAPLSARLKATCSNLPYAYEILFVNDGSTDASVAACESLASADARFKYIEFSRNFGKEMATSAGIAAAEGDAVIIIDADLQHPPELIPQFVQEWEGGAEVVIGVRRPRPGEGFLRSMGSRAFARIMNSISDAKSPVRATDYRLIDRKVADVFRTLKEHRRLTRALIDWLGFRCAYIPFDADERSAGTARYSLRKLFAAALGAIVAHSRLPLSLAGYLGAFITLTSGALGLFIIIEQVLLGDPLGIAVSGTAMLGVMILFLNGIVLACLGLIALYIGTIHEETAARPLYVVRRTINM